MSGKSSKKLRKWAYLRFSIVGPLLARPPEKGELAKELEELASRCYPHPDREEKQLRFAASTIERWYYQALGSDDPIKALSRKIRSDAGMRKAIGPEASKVLHNQYLLYPDWSHKLHADNLVAHLREQKQPGPHPSYATVLRLMKAMGWSRRPRAGNAGQKRASERLEKREVRSFEAAYIHQLWHLDFHHGRMRVTDSRGEWHTPKALCILDDRSRLCCHLQWYLGETTEDLIHGLLQAFFKRGLPRSLMSDNGSAMLAGETVNGLLRLGIVHERTLPYSAYQNGKIECFWGQLEGRLLSMLKRVKPLTLDFLNRASQAWVELEYNRAVHSETGASPISRLLDETSVARPAPGSEFLRLAFSIEETRAQRQSDGTFSIAGVRFEAPNRLRHMPRLRVRYQSWDLSVAHLVDLKDGSLITAVHPLDKTANSRGIRRVREPVDELLPVPDGPHDPIPPLLRSLLAQYAATGLPPAYIPKNQGEENPHDA